MDMSGVLAIGAFSRITHLSIKTLCRYHEAGLLEPATVDRHTGYRYYSLDQVPTAQVIHRFRDARYIDGGVRSSDNADLASGYAHVVVLSPLGGRSGTPPEGQFEGLRRPPEWGMDLAGQVEGLRKQGSRVEVITPDADSRAAMGTNQMDLATRIPAARAGFAQGKQEATRVTFL